MLAPPNSSSMVYRLRLYKTTKRGADTIIDCESLFHTQTKAINNFKRKRGEQYSEDSRPRSERLLQLLPSRRHCKGSFWLLCCALPTISGLAVFHSVNYSCPPPPPPPPPLPRFLCAVRREFKGTGGTRRLHPQRPVTRSA